MTHFVSLIPAVQVKELRRLWFESLPKHLEILRGFEQGGQFALKQPRLLHSLSC
jgi:hypothetical protein